jgi:formate-dependent nitrite reductase membrane component NrfD
VSVQTNLPSTFFTAPPGFGWFIILYFFIGGIAGGALMLAGLLRLFGRAEDRPYIVLASALALVGAAISGLLLIVDLSVPVRFWHMVVENHTGRLMFKWWSPMSVGVWILLAFSVFALLATLESLAELDSPRLRGRRALRQLTRPWIVKAGAIGGIVSGLALAGYTGVLLAVTNRPLWADSSWLGLVFLLSAVSTSMAALLLLSHWRRVRVTPTVEWLGRFDSIALIFEVIAIAAFLISLGDAARALLNLWGVLLVLGVIVAGIVVPFVLQRRPSHSVVLPAVLVLVGGLLLRVVILLGSERIHVVGTQAVR